MRCVGIVCAVGLLAGCGDDVATLRADAATDAAVVDVTDDARVSTDAAACDDAAVALVDETTARTLAERRRGCGFARGARVAETLGVTSAVRARIPIDHVVIVVQENRAFDHYLGALEGHGCEGTPRGYTNPDTADRPVSPQHLTTTCVSVDPPHQWEAMHTSWNMGRMDGFVRSGARNRTPPDVALGYYTRADLPFYYWLHTTFAMSDRYFASVLGGTWANRDFLYTGSSYGVRDTGQRTIPMARTVFDALDDAHVAWGVYTDGVPRQDSLGWPGTHRGVTRFSTFLAQLLAGTLPPVSFVDPAGREDEHPTGNVQLGEAWTRRIVTEAMASPLWPTLALIVTYDEAGGFFDHVPPPVACSPDPARRDGYDTTDLDRLGFRVPFVVVSPWSRPGHVSHVAHDHGATLRFVEALFDLPALTDRDANADALFDLFDFSCPRMLHVEGGVPAAGADGC
jgi:phospholipase C